MGTEGVIQYLRRHVALRADAFCIVTNIYAASETVVLHGEAQISDAAFTVRFYKNISRFEVPMSYWWFALKAKYTHVRQ